jgi:DNA polymerase III subunit chi
VTQIEFYTHVENKQQMACRLAAKAMRQGLRVMLYASDANTTDQLNRLLWTFPATGFVPHCRSADELAPVTPVIVDHLGDVLVHDEMLINLHPEWPQFFSRFKHLVEIVSTDEDDQREARLRYRFYRDRGYEIQHHDLRGDAAMVP